MNEWIKVSDRLPKAYDPVLVYYSTNLYMQVGYFDGTDWRLDSDCEIYSWTITHWMPLPEPPKP